MVSFLNSWAYKKLFGLPEGGGDKGVTKICFGNGYQNLVTVTKNLVTVTKISQPEKRRMALPKLLSSDCVFLDHISLKKGQWQLVLKFLISVFIQEGEWYQNFTFTDDSCSKKGLLVTNLEFYQNTVFYQPLLFIWGFEYFVLLVLTKKSSG